MCQMLCCIPGIQIEQRLFLQGAYSLPGDTTLHSAKKSAVKERVRASRKDLTFMPL